MAFIVEDGTGLINANSFATVAEADEYFSSVGLPTGWDTANKEQMLVRGTRYVQQLCGHRAKGTRCKREQALIFPRFDMVDEDGYGIDSDSVPAKVKEATIVAAGYAASGDLVIAESTAGTLKRERVVADTLEYEVEYGSGGASQQKRFPDINALLSGFLEDSERAERG